MTAHTSNFDDFELTRCPKVRDVIYATSRHFDVPVLDMLSSRRTKDIVRPRQIAMYLAKNMTPMSYTNIGRNFAGRDHTTVLHAVRKIQELVEDGNAPVISAVSAIRSEIASGLRFHDGYWGA